MTDTRRRFARQPPPGPFRREFWHSPLRGPWLSSFLGSALLPLIVICAVTGFLSHAAYESELGDNAIIAPGGPGIDIYFFEWPTSPAWLYALTQGLHVVTGLAAIPLLLAKLWSAMPKLFEWPPLRSPAHILERLSLAGLVGGSLFVFFTGVLNIQNYLPWQFSFVPAHYYAAFVFLAALALHIVVKLPVVRRAFRERGVVRPLRDDLAHTRPESAEDETTAPVAPAAPTISRRGLIGTVGAASVALGAMAAGQSIGGPLRSIALLAPRGVGTSGGGPNDFPVNRTALAAGIKPAQVGADWRLLLRGEREVRMSREELLEMPQQTHSLPIACVEGWSTTQDWTGVRLRDLAALAGSEDPDELQVQSLQRTGAFNQATLNPGQIRDPRSLLALMVNGAELSPDHGFPARVIVPALPGVHNTKWVASMTFRSV